MAEPRQADRPRSELAAAAMAPAPRGTILYASYVAPFPSNSGERIRARNLISGLRSLGCRVEALVGNYDKVDLAAYGSDGLRFQQIPLGWPGLRNATSLYFKPDRRFIDQVRALHRATPLSAILLDYGFMGAQIAPLTKIGVPIILGTHNLESNLSGQLPAAWAFDKMQVRLRQALEYAHERWFFRRADAVICVSEDDRRAYARFIPADRLCVVPNFVDVPDIYDEVQRQDRIIMTGSFDNFQNREGLRWFVDEVWNEELRARTTLYVAGKLSDQVTQEFGDRSIVGLGRRDDLLAEIAQSRCAIVPLWHGGGTRLKCIEAMAVRTPVVTTSKGCEGIEHNGAFLVADDPASFRAAIRRILDHPDAAARQADEARHAFDRRYSLAANAERLDRVLTIAAGAKRFQRRP